MAIMIIFWSKIRIFLIYVLKDSPHSCDHFHVKIMVVGGCDVEGNEDKLIKITQQKTIRLWCHQWPHINGSYIIWKSLVWSYVRVIFWGSGHVVALYSKMNKNLKMALKRHQVVQFDDIYLKISKMFDVFSICVYHDLLKVNRGQTWVKSSY